MNDKPEPDPNPAIRYGEDGSVTVSITLDPEHAAVWNNFDLLRTTDYIDSMLIVIGNVRRDARGEGQFTKAAWGSLLMHLERLEGRLTATKDAAIRRFRDYGGSYNDLATAMDVPRSTAQDAANRAKNTNRPYASWVEGSHDRDTTHMRLGDAVREHDAKARVATDAENFADIIEDRQAARDRYNDAADAAEEQG